MPLTPPSERFMRRALTVPTGIELEVDVGRIPSRNGSPTNFGGPANGEYLPAWYGEEWGLPEGWFPGIDCGIEVRSERPTPLQEQYGLLTEFVDWIGQRERHVHGPTRSCHVHINCDPAKGTACSPEHLLAAWFELRHEAYELVNNPTRLTNGYAEPLHDAFRGAPEPPPRAYRSDWQRPTGIPSGVPCGSELVGQLAPHGTLELRLWDSTDNEELLHRRMDFLQVLIARALQLEDNAKRRVRRAAKAPVRVLQEA